MRTLGSKKHSETIDKNYECHFTRHRCFKFTIVINSFTFFTPYQKNTYEQKGQSNLCTTKTPNLWLLMTGGRCSEVTKAPILDSKKVVIVVKWSLFGGGHKLRSQSYQT